MPVWRVSIVLLTFGLGSFAMMAGSTSKNSRAPGQTKYLDLKPGSWEVDMHTSTTGVLTPMSDDAVQKATASMNAEQRAQWTAVLRAREKTIIETAKKGTDKKSTLCPLNQNFEINSQGKFSPIECTSTTRSSGQQLHSEIICHEGNGNSAWQQTSDFERIDAENFKGTIQVSAKNDDNTMRVVTEEFSGKWLGDTCAPAPPPPLMAAILVVDGNDNRTRVGNLAAVPMTAYAIQIVMYGSNQRIRHFYDARCVALPPISPHSTKDEVHEGILLGTKPIAAVFADGSTFGDAREIADIMARRVDRLKGFAAVSSTLCSAQRNGISREAVLASLQSQKDKLPNLGTSMANSMQESAYHDAIFFMKQHPQQPVGIPETLKYVRDSAALLAADPIKDGEGKLYVKPEATQLSCGN
jgi:hypothetical protein